MFVASDGDVRVSDAYVAAKAAEIVPYASNTTNVTLTSPVWSGRFATLTIRGNRALEGTAEAKNGTGASVAEWAIVAGDAGNVARRSLGAWTG